MWGEPMFSHRVDIQKGLGRDLALVSVSCGEGMRKGLCQIIPETCLVSSSVLVQVSLVTSYFFPFFLIHNTLLSCHFICDSLAPGYLILCGLCVSPVLLHGSLCSILHH